MIYFSMKQRSHQQGFVHWISEFLLLMQETYILEALNHDTDIPCFVQRRMLWFFAPTSLNNDLLNDGVILEHVMKQPTWLSKVPFFCTQEDEYGKSLFPEVNMCNVGNYDNGCCNPEAEMNGWDLTLKMMKRMTTMDLKTSDTFAKKEWMELPFQIEAQKWSALFR